MHDRARHQWLGLAGWLALCFVAAGLGAIASAQAGSFYGQLAKPAWAPPAGVFGPVWTTLYALMGIAAWLVWREQGKPRAAALGLFVVQLAVNALWSWLFFRWQMGAAAFADVVLLLVLIVATVVAFWRLRRLAALLLAPYLAWVAFATALTWSVWQRNPAILG
ncbi:TspO/MBR family protein [Ramlibacter pallidus]|uniref:Tryptophan-rich sensory protein n=1 Tax=Ramlibacter pallidus TaxID=2780087 RepID=A0ABR9S5C8_9BURK|nr:TspO/MBR family protein [Ramlibacter pallidus]MBE7368705.1 tryptophan-rich sensory protein [Ramlibacter pallidus]